MSSTLTTLKVLVENFDDCLYLLDGRLDSLSTLIIKLDKISSTSTTIDNTVSLICNYSILKQKTLKYIYIYTFFIAKTSKIKTFLIILAPSHNLL